MLGQHRSTQRRIPTGRDDEERLTADIVELARQYGRYGYRKIAELLRSTAGWVINDKRSWGCASYSSRKRLMTACRLMIERKTPRFSRRFVSVAKNLSTALIHEHDIRVS